MKKILLVIICLFCLLGCKSNDLNCSFEVEKVHNTIISKDGTSDSEIVNYIENIYNNIESCDDINSVKIKMKNSFKILTDFIFYGGTIKGRTFDSLANEAKIEFINIYQKLDIKLEEKYPGYKNTIKETSKKSYKNVLEKASKVLSSIKEEYHNYVTDEDNKTVVRSFNNDKENIKNTYNKLKGKIKDLFN